MKTNIYFLFFVCFVYASIMAGFSISEGHTVFSYLFSFIAVYSLIALGVCAILKVKI